MTGKKSKVTYLNVLNKKQYSNQICNMQSDMHYVPKNRISPKVLSDNEYVRGWKSTNLRQLSNRNVFIIRLLRKLIQ